MNDCADDNARSRQQARFAGLFGVTPTFVGLGGNAPDIEAAGNLLDVLDARLSLPASVDHRSLIVLLNVAPRGDKTRKWDNGNPFCYFQVGDALVLSTYEGHALSLARDMGVVSEVELFDIPTVTAALQEKNILSPKEAEKINHTQFRSLEFLPLAAYWLHGGVELPSTTTSLEDLPSVSGKVWFVDNFGNVKTTLRLDSINIENGTAKLPSGKELPYYERLADVPHGEFAITKGSSGFKDQRLLEITKQQGNASRELSLSVGSDI